MRRPESGALLDLHGNIPTFIRITDGKGHDVNILDELLIEAGAFYAMDRGYIDFDAIGSPDRDAGSKEVCILDPYRTYQCQRCCKYRPIILITTAQALPGLVLEGAIGFPINRFNQVLQVSERR